MTTIRLETQIQVPVELCFDLARNLEIHQLTTAQTRERAVPPGITSGMIGPEDTITFEAFHLGMWQRLSSRITEFERPHRFADVMTKGAFASLRHVHEFFPQGDGTLMRDTMEFVSPLGPLGILVDVLFLKRYMQRFLEKRNAALKHIAESGEWRQVIKPSENATSGI
jgi:ligand-binding SRPBCC domain-containing protein